MKKIAIFSLAAVMMVSCGGNQKSQNQDIVEGDSISFEQEQIEAGIKVQIDSLAAEFARMQQMPFMQALKNGELLLTEEEKLAKPDYLVDPIAVEELITLSQKYRAVAILTVDRTLAKAYEIDIEPYDNAIKSLLVQINDPAFDAFTSDDDTPFTEAVQQFYDTEDENGRINFFWETVTTVVAEEIYTLAQHQDDALMACIDDHAAESITLRVALLQDGLERLSVYAPELEQLCETIRPLQQLNALTAQELKEQVAGMKDEIEAIRNSLLLD